MQFITSNKYPTSSKRNVAIASKGMVATSNPLAAQAGLQILQQGGNAIDAAIAAAATLTVVSPTSNGLGGDLFAIVYHKGMLHGLNASGPTPKDISIEKVKAMGYKEMPKFGVVPITVPGQVKGWSTLSKKFGILPFKECLNAAILYAKDGYPVAENTAENWNTAYLAYKRELHHPMYDAWFETFAPKGESPKKGEIFSSQAMAKTLEKIASTNGEAMYTGDLAKSIVSFVQEHKGFLSMQDLASYEVSWVNPVSVNYRGYDVFELPPNGQGIVAQMALNILENVVLPKRESEQTVHYQLEAIKMAFADGLATITDPKKMKHTLETLLSKSYAKTRASAITKEAANPAVGKPFGGGTVYLATADKEGNMVSLIQSNYMGFGSGIVIPKTGIAMQNRGHTFSLQPSHINALAGGKRTYHTIIPGFLMKDKVALGPFGVMGGFMQPQGHVQVVMNMIDFCLNPQAALDALRWCWMEGKTIHVEAGFSPFIIEELEKRGHHIVVDTRKETFGRGQIIIRDPKTGVLYGGTEMRTDSSIACY